MKSVVRKNHLNSCYKTTIDRAQWPGSVIGTCPKIVSKIVCHLCSVCITIDHLDNGIISQAFIKALSIGCYQLLMLPNNVREGLRMAFAIPGKSLQQKLQLFLILAQLPESW